LQRQVRPSGPSSVTLFTICTRCGDTSADAVIERRAYPRTATQAPIRFNFDRKTHFGHTLDLSENGLAFRCEVPLPKGLTLTVELEAEESRFLLTGTVVWSQPAAQADGDGNGSAAQYDMGLMLLWERIDPKTQEAYRNFVRGL